jgi:ABC-2 type transport system permease protein
MAELGDVMWVEWRKALRSGMLLYTALGSLLLPLGVAFLVFVARHPETAQKLGMVGSKANLLAFAATDWPLYLSIFGQATAVAGFILFVLVLAWVFGREFADGTLKDLLAVPVSRSAIVLAKYAVFAAWSAALGALIFVAGVALGALMQLPAASGAALLHGALIMAASVGLSVVTVLPFALAASAGRGYLLPIGLAILALGLTNLAVVLGVAEYVPWGVGGLLAQGTTALGPLSYLIVALTGLAGVAGTVAWWNWADQDR